MEKDMMILAKDQYYSLDCYETKLNNNVMVVGAAGAGKTRSIVTPNLLQATGSYIVTDPKGNLYNQYADYLKEQGYVVKKLDFTDPMNSHHYNFFNYIHSTQDIVKIAHMLIYQHRGKGTLDPFWDEAAQLLLQALIALLLEFDEKDRNIGGLHKLVDMFYTMGDLDSKSCPLDNVFENVTEKDPKRPWKR